MMRIETAGTSRDGKKRRRSARHQALAIRTVWTATRTGWLARRCGDEFKRGRSPNLTGITKVSLVTRILTSKLVIFASGLVVGGLAAAFITTLLNRPIEDLRYFATAFVGLLGIIVGARTYAHHVRQAANERNWRQTRSQVILPIELSTITGYAEECMLVANAYRNRIQLRYPDSEITIDSDKSQDAPRISDTTIDRIAEAAADLDLEQIGDLLRNYQIQHARLSGLIERYNYPMVGSTSRLPSTGEATICLRDAARLYILAERQFDAARGAWIFRDPEVKDEDIDERLKFRGFADKLPK